MTANMKTYTPSGIAPPMGLLTSAAYGLGAAAGLGLLYALLVQFNPFIYINLLATAGFGFVIGYAVHKGAIVGKVRAPLLASGITLLSALAGLYLSWLVWINLLFWRSNAGIIVWDPITLVMAIQAVAEVGAWTLKSWTPTGLALYLAWTCEALIIIGAAMAGAWEAGKEPFCEQCGQWASADYVQPAGIPGDVEVIKKAVLDGDLDRLAKLPQADPNGFLMLEMASCHACNKNGWLTAQRAQVKVDGKGRKEIKKQPLVKARELRGESVVAARSLPERLHTTWEAEV